MIEYEFLKAEYLGNALKILDSYKNVKLLAGGTDILVDIHKKSKRLGEFNYILDISNIKELKYIEETNQTVEIGPLCTHTMLIESELISNLYPFLVTAAKTIGSPQIRNRGTVGGNISNASPAADLVPPLIALETQLELSSVEGKRFVPLEKYIIGPYKTSQNPDELITKIIIPKIDKEYFGVFLKIGRRRAVNIARLNLAILAKVKQNIIEDIRIVPGSATPYPVRFTNLEQEITGKRIDQIIIEKITPKISEEMISITGERWSTPYKKPALEALFKRGMESIFAVFNN
ncbi:FAD binding domain-containing protein [Petrotoga halophila]|uniref:Molybdopterin dehydrogenase n=1 Tax=Petrotoga halophila DSM 16923 TaxID=1122953 RepID=A0A2S5EDX5_9BACT|nr:xanthine dehydrogenase family protein subunit M [Petrotoga halophila]POZ91229.1 molybdopterin dehydrogenase [Petrotoga halophila DSM 16923]